MSDEIVSVVPLSIASVEPIPKPYEPPAIPENAVVEREEDPAYELVEKDETLEQLRNDIEEEIKRAGEPVDAVIKLLERFDELDLKVRQGGSRFTAWEEFKSEYSRVQRKLGEATGYRAALASSVLAFVLERRRR